jgi:hypothetical protein
LPVSNGPKEATYLSSKFPKRIGFGVRSFAHYRIRAMLYAGRPNHTPMSSAEPPLCAAHDAFGYRLRLLHELAEKVLGLYPDPVCAS